MTPFLYISLPLLHDYDVKMPNFTFYEGRNKRQRSFLSLSKLECGPKKSTNQKFPMMNWARWNKRDEIWSCATSLFNWPFRSRRRCCWLSSLASPLLLERGSTEWEVMDSNPSLPADVLWGSFVTHSFLPRGGEMNAWQTNTKGRLRGGYSNPGQINNQGL